MCAPTAPHIATLSTWFHLQRRYFYDWILQDMVGGRQDGGQGEVKRQHLQSCRVGLRPSRTCVNAQ